MTLFSDAMRRDPYPVYKQLQAQGPVVADAQKMIYMVFDYQTVKRVLSDHENFSSQVSPDQSKPLDWLVYADPPRHTRLRQVFSKVFGAKSVTAFQARIEKITRDLINLSIERGELDLVSSFSGPLPGKVIADVIGIPDADQSQFLVWNEALHELSHDLLGHQMTPQQALYYRQIQQQLDAYLSQQLAQRRRSGQDDLLTRLVEAESDGIALSESEIMGFVQLLYSGATETTTNLIGNAVLALLEHPEQLALLQARPELAASAVEEVLRYRSPIQTLIRRTRQPVELQGQMIPAGKYIFAVLGAAHRDASVFAEPDRFDIQRDPNPHLAFGYGVHYCMGTPLARLEAKIAIPAIFKHFKNLQLVNDQPWQPQTAEHVLGPARLKLRFQAGQRLI